METYSKRHVCYTFQKFLGENKCGNLARCITDFITLEFICFLLSNISQKSSLNNFSFFYYNQWFIIPASLPHLAETFVRVYDMQGWSNNHMKMFIATQMHDAAGESTSLHADVCVQVMCWVWPLTENTQDKKWEPKPEPESAWGQCPPSSHRPRRPLPPRPAPHQSRKARGPAGSLFVLGGSWLVTWSEKRNKRAK